MFSSPVKLGIA